MHVIGNPVLMNKFIWYMRERNVFKNYPGVMILVTCLLQFFSNILVIDILSKKNKWHKNRIFLKKAKQNNSNKKLFT